MVLEYGVVLVQYRKIQSELKRVTKANQSRVFDLFYVCILKN